MKISSLNIFQSSTRLRQTFLACLLLLANVVFVRAISPAQYGANVREAKSRLEKLQESFAAEETVDFKQAANEINRLIPSEQKIEFADRTEVNSDNAWLASSLEAIKAETAIEQKLIKLNHVIERLGAIENRVSELVAAEAAATAKADDKQVINEILRRAEYQKAPTDKEKSVLERLSDLIAKMFEDFLRWLFGNPPPAPNVERPSTDFSAIGSLLRYAVIALAIAIIGFVFWRFVLPIFGGERRRGKSGKKQPRVILGETLAPDATAESLLAQAERLALSGDIRQAIRKGYIALLCELSDRKLLGLAGHKTNQDYLRDVQRRSNPIFEPMHALTSSFEQHWYGETPATEQDWHDFRGQYREIVSERK